ncbi:Hypothetical predicted protein [Cloeon dipterum]|uniref:Cytochrome P450 n=1 Tax=Cloeon dipterum TaxID=197152 RepID=A0A8S1C0W3_9INSE|nr:Hypothetical predicted protein [Cloeon dipterum]
MFLANSAIYRPPVAKRVFLIALKRRATSAAATASAPVKSYDEIPGPKPLPLIGNAWRFLPYIGSWDTTDFAKWTKSLLDEYGKIVKIGNLPGRKDMIMIFDPDTIADVFKNEGPYPERMKFESVKYYREKIRPDFYEGFQGIVNENGERWLQARSIINQPMMKIEVANLFVPKSDQVSKDFVKLVKAIRGSNMEMAADFKNEIHKWALESIALISLDTRLGCLQQHLAKDSDAQKMIDAVVQIFELTYELDFKVPFWKLFPSKTMEALIGYSDNVLEISLKYVDQARSKFGDLSATETPEMSVLQRILKRDQSSKRAVIMCMDMIFAGVDTTSNTAACTLYYLACNPDKQEKLYLEIISVVLANPCENLTAEHLNKMKYLKACIKEATRLAPVVNGTARALPKDVVLHNYLIPKQKADIFMFNSTLYLQEEHYPDAKKFIPERWMREDKSCPVRKANKAHPFVFLPFGHGVRQCPGMRFANMEMETFIARMLLEFKVEWHQPPLTFISKALQTPLSPLQFTILDRNK